MKKSKEATPEQLAKFYKRSLYAFLAVILVMTFFMLVLTMHSYEASAKVACEDGYEAMGYVKADNVIMHDSFGSMLKLHHPEDSVNWMLLDHTCSYEIVSDWEFR